MQLLRIINIALFALIITLILQMFISKPVENPTTGIFIRAEQSAVTVPNIPKITLFNQTDNEISINTCEDIKISRNSSLITGLENVENFCNNITVSPKSSTLIDLGPLHKMFASSASVGKYIFTLNSNDGEKQIAFDVEKPGFFRSILSTLIYQPIYNLFVGILMILPGHELGWAIILVTIIIRLFLLIPQHKMLVNSKKLANLTPKLKALQEEYKDDRATLGMKMMELYKKENVSPMGSCLPLLIQLPILMTIYWVIMGITDVSNFYHLYSFFKDFDISAIQTMFFGVNLLQVGGTFGIAMGILLAVTQWLQSYLSFKNQPKIKKPEKKADDAMPSIDPEFMQKMMLYFFPIMIGVSGIFFPLGLGLYWWIGLLFMIVQQIYVNSKDIQNKTKGEIVKKS